MSLSLSAFNELPRPKAVEELMRCCGCARWAETMADARPFASLEALHEAADETWRNLAFSEWLEAFSHHPRIGEEGLRAKFASTAGWAEQEQKGVQGASDETLKALVQGNREYEEKFGHLFLICATGKSADEMLGALRKRLGNAPEREMRLAADEQAKITRLRLERLFAK